MFRSLKAEFTITKLAMSSSVRDLAIVNTPTNLLLLLISRLVPFRTSAEEIRYLSIYEEQVKQMFT
jgi:hypothetical protein